MTRWQPCGHAAGWAICQLAETSSGGWRQYGTGARHEAHADGLRLLNSLSRIAYSCAGGSVVRDTVLSGPLSPLEHLPDAAVLRTARSGYHASPMRPALASLAAAFLAAGSAAFAQPAKSVFLEDLTWPEVREATKAGRTTIIIPVGGTEQSGPHLALGKHNVRARILAARIAESLGNALVAPVVAYVPEGHASPPTGHMRFPGTITVPESVFEQTLESAGRGFRMHGFHDVVLLGDHGGYQKSLKKVAEALNREWTKTKVRAHAIDEYYRAASVDFPQLLRGKGFATAEIGEHAGAADTSLALAADPALVRVDRMKAPNMGKADGVEGDPRRASAELGKEGLDLIVARTVEAIRKATARR